MESIQRMVPPDSPLIALAQQGVEAAGNIIATTPMAENHRGEPSSGNRSHERAKRAKVKQHFRPAAIGVWSTTTRVGG
jgi:hypothetical protein